MFTSGELDTAEAEEFEEGFEDTFEVVDIEIGVLVGVFPEVLGALAGDGDGDAAFFAGGGVIGQEDAADFEEGDVMVLVAGVMVEGIEQAGEEAGAEGVHVTAEGVMEQDGGFCDPTG